LRRDIKRCFPEKYQLRPISQVVVTGRMKSAFF
jgi:hypothetical protein